MNVFVRILALFCITLATMTITQPSLLLGQSKAEKDKELPPRGEYERALKHFGTWKDKFNDVEYWKNIVITRVSDKKTFHVKDLDDFDRDSFFVSNLRRLGFEMTRLNGFWQEEVKTYTAMPPTQEGVPSAAEITKYIERLTKLRKQSAQVLEAFAEKYVRDNPTKITKEDGEQLMRQIKGFHDENKLIERKK